MAHGALAVTPGPLRLPRPGGVPCRVTIGAHTLFSSVRVETLGTIYPGLGAVGAGGAAGRSLA